MNAFRKVAQAVVAYLRENPGAVTLLGGWAVIALAHFGLRVTIDQLSAIVTVLLPLVVGTHVAAHKARVKRIHNSYRAVQAGRAEAPPAA